jgi:hypothetical protein
VGFEFIYAYIENLEWMCIVGSLLLTSVLAILIYLRTQNEIDGDDWHMLMMWVVPAWLGFIVLCFNPSMEHIKQVRNEVRNDIIEIKEEKSNAPIYYPSNYCVNSLMCGQ